MPLKPICYAALASLAFMAHSIHAQNAEPEQAQRIVPLAGVHYRYWPKEMVQWIGSELPYSMIVLDIDDRGAAPAYDLQMIERNGGKAVHYTNTAEEAAIDQRAGLTVHQVAMEFDGPRTPEKNAQFMLRFNTETGTPVVWQFVLGTDISGQGSGLSPIPAANPILSYRGQGGLAGQGTALRVGNTTSTAEVWKELAYPPFFVPYRGAFSTGIQVLSFVPESAVWHRSGQTLTGATNESLSVVRSGDTAAFSDNALGTTASYTFEGSSIARVTFGPTNGKREDTVTLQFSPALAPGGQSSFEVIAGKKTRIAAGSVRSANTDPQRQTLTWSFSAPSDLKGKTAAASANLQP